MIRNENFCLSKHYYLGFYKPVLQYCAQTELPADDLGNGNFSDGVTFPTEEVRKINQWILYLDPAMSILLVMIITTTTAPLFKQSSLILLQTVPSHIEVDVIKEQ